MTDQTEATTEGQRGRMGERAVYVGVTEDQLQSLVDADPSTLLAQLGALRATEAPTYSMGEMWDGLHFLLAGVSADSPIEDDPLSEAVVGVHLFDAPAFVGCTEHDELDAVIDALAAVDIDAELRATGFTRFDDASIWPYDWNEFGDKRHEALAAAFAGLTRFMQECRDAGLHLS